MLLPLNITCSVKVMNILTYRNNRVYNWHCWSLVDVPSVVLNRNNYIVGYGDRVTIGCTVSSNPAHTSVYWQRIRNGVTQTITLSSNIKYSGSSVTTPSLTILNVDDNDEGDYICYATNSVGTGQSSRGTLEVTGSKFCKQVNIWHLGYNDKYVRKKNI
jgi:hypothetical protein